MFIDQFNKINTEIEFKPSFNNGTGYFDPAVELVKLNPGEEAKTTCPETGRKIIFIGTRLGTIVVFQRYSNPTKVIAYNAQTSSILKALLGDSALTENRVCSLIGRFGLNWDIENIFKEAEKHLSTYQKI